MHDRTEKSALVRRMQLFKLEEKKRTVSTEFSSSNKHVASGMHVLSDKQFRKYSDS